jgi:hypothetical protein
VSRIKENFMKQKSKAPAKPAAKKPAKQAPKAGKK